MTAAEAPLVDAHAHIWGPDTPYVATAWKRLDYAYTTDVYLDQLDRNGIRYGVIAAASLFGTYNDYTIAALKQHKRLRGTAIVEPTISFEELKAMRDAGIVGVRLQWFNLDPLPDLRRLNYRDLAMRLRDLDMHVHVNIEGGRLPQVLTPLAEAGVKLVVDHFGWSDDRLDPGGAGLDCAIRLAQQGRCWIKLSSGFNYKSPDVPRRLAEKLLAEVGTERLFWGTDAPFVTHEHLMTVEKAVADFADWVPDAQKRREIGETAHRFYFS